MERTVAGSGNILVVVKARTDNMAQCARQAMARHGAVAPERAPH